VPDSWRFLGPNSVPGKRGYLVQRLRDLVEHPVFTWTIIGLIFINAFILAIDALPGVGMGFREPLLALDDIILWIFVVELALRLIAHGRRFFTDPWSLFDTVVVAISFSPAAGGFAALRAFRVFRVLRLVSAFPRLRSVVRGLLLSIPGIASVAALLVLIVFVSSILGFNLYGELAPQYFGNLWTSMFTLFKVMTLEGWPEIADNVMAVYPGAWMFFLGYILVATLTLLNFFIAIIVNAMEAEALENKATIEMQESLGEEIRALRSELQDFRDQQAREFDDIEERMRGRPKD